MSQLINKIKTFKADQRILVYSILIFVTVFLAIMLFPEVSTLSPELNDNAFHYPLCLSIKGEIETGGNPLDHWVPYWCLGYPVFHYYQYLPHLMVVSAYYLFLKMMPLSFIFHLFIYLLLVFYPLILYFSLRKMHLPELAAAGAALFSLALSNNTGHGAELASYTWRGFGLFPQLCGMFLFPLTISSIYETLEKNKSYFRSVLLIFLLTISQVMFGWMAILTCLLFLFINFDRAEIFQRIKRLAVIMVFFFVAIAHFIIPVQLDLPYYAMGNYIPIETMTSYGFKYVSSNFFNGDMMDAGRLPILTVLAIIGLFFAFNEQPFAYRFGAVGFLVWFLLSFGKVTWGPLLGLLPFISSLQLSRFISMVHYFGTILAGIGLASIYERIRSRISWILAVTFILLLICPVFWDRYLFLKQNNEWLRSNKQSYDKEKVQLQNILDKIKVSSPGRAYAGSRANWGANFKIGFTSVLYFFAQEDIPVIGFTPFSWALPSDASLNFNEYEPSHYDLFNVRYVIGDASKTFPAFAKEVKRSGRFHLYEVKTTGYFDLVGSPIAIYCNKETYWNPTLTWLKSQLAARKQFLTLIFDRAPHNGYEDYLIFKDMTGFWRSRSSKEINKMASMRKAPVDFLSIKDPFNTEKYPAVNYGSVLSEKAGKNIFSGKVRAEKDCFLLFKMTYHPGWHAYIDGKEKEKTILSPGMIGVKINKGTHDVKFIYSAPRWKTPLLFAGIFSLIALYWWEKKHGSG